MRSTRLALALVAIAGVVSATQNAAATVPEPAAPETRVLAPVVVSGARPGPGLWKVSSGEHTLWILGLVSPVPRRMEWYSPETEALLRHTQEIIARPQVGAHLGWGGAFKVALAMPTILRARQNPEGKTLHDVLPPELHARWLALKARYLPADKDVEHWRPPFAAGKLYGAALESVGLEYGGDVDKRIDSLARENRIRTTVTAVELKLDDPKGLAKSISRSKVDETACFRSVLDRLDADVAFAAERANAWAVGDVAALERLSRRKSPDPCFEAFLKVDAIRDMGVRDAQARSEEKWIKAVEAALAAKETSFTTLSMEELLDEGGLLSRLRARGYVVVAPE